MRKFVTCLLGIVLLGVMGCGGEQESPREPGVVSEDEIRKMDQEQQAVDAAEREQRKSQP